MTREIYSVRTKAVTLSVTGSEITAVQKSDTLKTGLRLYDGGFIGIAGTLGAPDEDKLLSHARHMLKFKIPYGGAPSGDMARHADCADKNAPTDEQFVEKARELLSRLRAECPQFAFSHKLRCTSTEKSIRNDAGLDLSYTDKHITVELIIKHKQSKNLFDGFGVMASRMFDVDEAFKAVTRTCRHYDEKAELTDGRMPVVLFEDHTTFLSKFYTDLNARQFGAGASMFSGKVGERLFGENFTLRVDREPVSRFECFFDAEGTVLPGDSFTLIENGVLKSPYTSKRTAKQYGYDATGSAAGEYDAVPDALYEAIAVKPCDKTIKELLGGRKAVLAEIASGGDFTAQGEFASPVQTAYLFDGERVYGRLPQIAISSNIYDMFGKDFIGASKDGSSPGSPFKYLTAELDVKKIGGYM